ncbi:tandem-95 repeat protein, partial [Labilibaculum sp. DW002]
NGTEAYTLSGTDADAGTVFTYSMPVDAAYEIVGDKILVKDGSLLDYEAPSNGTRVFTVTVSDGTNSSTATITINLSPVNDNTPALADGNNTIPENSANGTEAYTLSGTDADAGTVFTYTMPVDAAYEIVGDKILVKDANLLDYEAPSNGTRVFTVTVSDGTNSSTATITINLSPVNDNTPALADGNNTIPENSANGTEAYTLSGTDADAGTVFTYTMPVDAAYEISGDKILVKDASLLDYEAPSNGTRVLTVTVSDGANSSDATITINLSPVNDNTPALADGNNTIPENSANGTEAYTLSGTDADAGTVFTYSMPVDAAYEISGDKILVKDASLLDYEAPSNGTRVFTVTVSDGTNSSTAVITINLSPVNDNDPILSAIDVTIDEGLTVVQTVSATDADAGDTKSFTISGTDASLFDIDLLSGELTFKLAPDFEIPGDANGDNVYELLVTVADGAFHTDAKLIKITVQGVNDNTPALADGNNTILENSANGIEAYTLSGTDADAGTVFTYSMPVDAAYEVVGNKILVKDGSLLDYDVSGNGTRVFTVTVSDGTNSSTAAITINLSPVNDNTPALADGSTTIPENTANGTEVFVLNGTDVDGDPLTYSMPDDSTYEIIGNKIVVKDGSLLDYDVPGNGTRVIIVTVSDGDNSSTATITINLSPVNDNAPVLSDGMNTIPENSSNGTLAYVLSGTDVDGGIITYSIPDNDAYELVNNKIVVKDGSVLDYEGVDHGTRILIITVSDGLNSSTATITINLSPVNDNNPVITAEDVTIDEGTTFIEIVTGLDADEDDLLIFSISGEDAGLFTIDPVTGELRFKVEPDFEMPQDSNGNNIYEFEVHVTDEAGNVDTKTIYITVEGVNDNAPIAENDVITIDEDGGIVEGDILLNDSDLDGDDLIISTTPVSDVSNGTLTINDDGTYTYEPDDNFNGTDTFVYEVCDNGDPKLCSEATVTITINPVNDAPEAFDTFMEVKEESKGNVIEVDRPIDLDEDVLSVKIISVVEFGAVRILGGDVLEIDDIITVEQLMNLTYDTRERHVGEVMMKYQVIDSEGLIAAASINIKISPEEVFIPEVITPNGDEYNERFVIVGIGNFPNNSLHIFNRWGNTVYKMKNYDNSWEGYGNVNGQFSHNRLPPGTYYYVLNIGGGKKLTGYVYLRY